MTITDALIEKVARRMCAAMEIDPDALGFFRPGGYGCIMWRGFEDRARDAIAAHIALAEIMPPNRAMLLAVADAASTVSKGAGEIGEDSLWSAQAVCWGQFAAALRAKAGGGE